MASAAVVQGARRAKIQRRVNSEPRVGSGSVIRPIRLWISPTPQLNQARGILDLEIGGDESLLQLYIKAVQLLRRKALPGRSASDLEEAPCIPPLFGLVHRGVLLQTNAGLSVHDAGLRPEDVVFQSVSLDASHKERFLVDLRYGRHFIPVVSHPHDVTPALANRLRAAIPGIPASSPDEFFYVDGEPILADNIGEALHPGQTVEFLPVCSQSDDSIFGDDDGGPKEGERQTTTRPPEAEGCN